MFESAINSDKNRDIGLHYRSGLYYSVIRGLDYFVIVITQKYILLVLVKDWWKQILKITIIYAVRVSSLTKTRTYIYHKSSCSFAIGSFEQVCIKFRKLRDIKIQQKIL